MEILSNNRLYKSHRYSIEGMNNKAFILDRTKNELIAEAQVYVDNKQIVHGYDELRDYLSKNNIKPIN
jgi:hypothetical protein